MKRTAEIVLGVIGMCISALFVLLGLIYRSAKDSEAVRQQLMNQSVLKPEDVDNALTSLSQAGTIWIIVGIIGIILGIVALVLLKGNKSPIWAGCLLIIGAVLIAIISTLTSIVQSILFLIAGILALVRKPKQNFNT
ncbi:DUF4064 domain-containing protein [Camelliibacillus cellulosilyticus]|uniref:DUF4064 domain-containing protein n=1 Tax=Camelliibacillus cellulosilyticus TaxID=2174486 RepID=A0ABV9GMY9_9BACL